ncbi:MAG TPA: hypothetical protein VFM18_21860 [Methanosarcina sp.]|nr:hypothetical protein [Methanosarcina sp.]
MFEEASVEDLKTIFVDSVIRYKNTPIYIYGVDHGKNLEYQLLTKDQHGIVHISDKGLNFKPVELGMVNHGGYAAYIQRIPVRGYKQGLSSINIEVKKVHELPQKILTDLCKIKNSSLAKCIKGEYPSLQEAAVHLMEKDIDSLAFSRTFALDKDMWIYHKTSKVGLYDAERDKIIFSRGKSYLKELL